MKLKLGTNLSLPLDAVTQTWGFFGRKGSGKTYSAGRLVESFLDASVQVVVLDPVGNWYGLRLDKSGKRPSRFQIPILGGQRGDVALEVTGGSLVASTVVESGTSVVLDVSQFRKAERKRFMADFAEELFHRKKSARSPMHLVIEEAQLFAPQMAKGEERMLGAMEDLVRLGRNYGIGCTMISQRPQSVNTEVRNQCEPLVVFQLVAEHERNAIKGWMQHMGVDVHLEELSKLAVGECFFWSPAWMKVFKRVKFDAKETFDASSTPKVGDTVKAAAKLKAIDLAALEKAMAATIERAKADDPAELRKEIAALKRQLTGKQPAAADPAAIERAVASAVKDRDRHWQGEIAKVQRSDADKAKRLAKIEQIAHLNGAATPIVVEAPKAIAVRNPAEFKPVHKSQSAADSSVTKTQQRILDALAWYESLGNQQPSLSQVGAVALLDTSGGHFSNVVGPLSSAGLVERGQGLLRLTDAGRALANPIEQPQSLDEYHDVLRRRVLKMKTAKPKTIELLDAIIDAGGREMTAAEIGEAVRIDHTGGHFSNMIGPLGTAGLIVRRGGVVTPTEILFPNL